MKKSAISIISSVILFFISTNCTKTSIMLQPATQSVSALLNSTEIYTFTLPQSSNGNPYQITNQANGALISTIITNNSGDEVYQFKPDSSFAGVANVVISNVSGSQNNCTGKKPALSRGVCEKNNNSTPDNSGNIINLKLTVTKANN